MKRLNQTRAQFIVGALIIIAHAFAQAPSASAQAPGAGYLAPVRTTRPTASSPSPARTVSPGRNRQKRKDSYATDKGSIGGLLLKGILRLALTIAIEHREKQRQDVQFDQHLAQNRPVLKIATGRPQYRSPDEILRSARSLFVRSRSGFFKGEVFEREILKRSEKEKLELIITRDASEADLIIEVYRKRFSTRFVFSVIEPVTKRVLASDKSSSLGGDIEPDLANLLIKRFKAARQ